MLAPFIEKRKLPPIPAHEDYLSLVDAWPLYANDRHGDCVFAAIGHYIQASTRYASGITVTVTEQDILGAYSAVTGFDPAIPATDAGTVMQDGMDYWRKTGIAGHRIVAAAAIDPHDTETAKAALSLFGGLLVGFNFPDVAMDQFDHGQPWTVVPQDGGINGGHAIHVGRYMPWDNITWGRVQTMTPEFWDKYVDEVWVPVTPEWLGSTGHTPSGLDLNGLGEAFSSLTGKPNPFPAKVHHPRKKRGLFDWMKGIWNG